MASLLCISEIEETRLFESTLTVSLKQQCSMYCVLIKTYFILFKKPSDIISFKRLPINNKTKLEFDNSQNRLLIIIGSIKYIFSSHDAESIERLFNIITSLISSYINPKPLIGYEYTEVKIDQIGNSEVYILMEQKDYHLFIFENLDDHKDNIVSHVINCKFYSIESDSQSASSSNRSTVKSLVLLGRNQTFKLTFKDEASVTKWKAIFLRSMNLAFNDDNVEVLKSIYDNESNRLCADCNSPNPEWVSINLCVVICINCAGIHRSLGTSYSRIQSTIIDQRIWEDINLIEILKEIGNEKSNSFWCKNEQGKLSAPLVDYSSFIKDKYVTKRFLDKEFIDKSEDELKEQLKLSVGKKDLFLTMRLWHSKNFDFQSEFVEELLTISRNSQQNLQEKFISLQPIISNINIHNLTISENVLQIAYNDSEKLNDLFLVSLLNNCISIKVENSAVTPIELISVCCIYYDNVNLVWYDYNSESLVVSVNPASNFNKIIGRRSLNNYNQIDVNRLSFFSQSKQILKDLKSELLKLLILDREITVNDESILFMNINVRKNSENFTKCKCFIIDHEIVFSSPFSMLYDLKKSEKCILMDDKKSIVIKFKVDELEIVTSCAENQKIIYNYLEKGSKCIELLKDPIDKMIFFISSRGLKSEGIFRVGGTIKKVDALYKTIERSSNNFTIDPNVYNVNDVASCLKKYFRSLDEPIITHDLFDLFKRASCEENEIEKNILYKVGLSRLSRDNYIVLRKLVELFFMVQMSVNDNRMDSLSLAISVSSSFISFDNSNIQINSKIMRELIDNFVGLFDYSESELEILKRFVEGPEIVDLKIIRNFYVHPKLTDSLLVTKFEHGKLNFLDRDNNYLIINVNISKCVVIKQVYENLFKDFDFQLWHFLAKRSGFSLKVIKRLIYLNDGTKHSILYPRTIESYDSYFVFLLKSQEKNSPVRRLFQCEVKLKSERYQDFNLYMIFPNSLQFFDNRSQSLDPVHDFKLSDIIVYRFHTRNVSKIFILFGTNGFLKCKFDNMDVLKEFLCFYDQFRN